MDALTLMSWNVRYFGHGTRGLRSTRGWMRKVASALGSRESLPDVIALQEVETSSLRGGLRGKPQLDRFQAMLHEIVGSTDHYRGVHFPSHRYAVGGTSLYTQGLAVLLGPGVELEHHDVHDITHVRLSAFERVKQRRIAAHLRLRVRGAAPIDLFNTHLSLPAFFEVGLHRIADRMGFGSNQLHEASTLRSIVEDVSNGRAIVVGDFNSMPGSPVYDHLCGASLRDAYAESHGLSLAELLEQSTAGFFHKRMHIDHVFSSPGVHWLDFEDHSYDRAGPFAGLSDHAPKVGRFSLR
jgi:endonuclease/exonuclease/phosphatase family metal-dependent hydrolase